MGDRRSTRRTSARLSEKLDAQEVNGTSYAAEKGKANGVTTKSVKVGSEGNSRGKRKLDYDEEDDGFMFSRTRSKRTKATQALKVPEPVVEEQPELPKALPTRKSRKKSAEEFASNHVEKEDVAPRRRSTRNSGDKSTITPSEIEVPKRRPKEPSVAKSKKLKEPQMQPDVDDEDRMDLVGGTSRTPVQNLEIPTETTKIALPFADTPIIRRNKEMRKGERRSSLGMRGRRASSLIDSGTSNGQTRRLDLNVKSMLIVAALPHSEVESAEFFKHIEANLPEPRRMRQLLTWCGTRALGDRPSFATEDSHAKLAAREIQQQLLADFGNKSELSDWFSREDGPSKPQILRPNPRNIANASKIEELEKQLARLQTERSTWEGILKPSSGPYSIPPLPQTVPAHQDLDPSSLNETDNTALSSFQGVPTSITEPVSLQSNVRARLNAITSSVEFETDELADNVRVLTQYLQGAEQVGSGVLSACAKILDTRDREAAARQGGESVGAREVLRALSRAVEREQEC
ncbi:MAG: hypothetical protein MMC23_006894 [Stictis urceolatum]|nr:hypothetical protein [Stictis urceolata]